MILIKVFPTVKKIFIGFIAISAGSVLLYGYINNDKGLEYLIIGIFFFLFGFFSFFTEESTDRLIEIITDNKIIDFLSFSKSTKENSRLRRDQLKADRISNRNAQQKKNY